MTLLIGFELHGCVKLHRVLLLLKLSSIGFVVVVVGAVVFVPGEQRTQIIKIRQRNELDRSHANEE